MFMNLTKFYKLSSSVPFVLHIRRGHKYSSFMSVILFHVILNKVAEISMIHYHTTREKY
jgi:hypothetical protein